MFFNRPVVKRFGEAFAKPETAQRIGDVARGISTIASLANRASGGLLKTAVETIPGGSLALKGASYGLKHAQPVAEFLGRAYSKASSAPK